MAGNIYGTIPDTLAAGYGQLWWGVRITTWSRVWDMTFTRATGQPVILSITRAIP